MDAALLLLVGLLMVCLNRTGAQTGVCYGPYGDNLPSPQEVVNLYKSQNISRMRIYSPDEAILDALKDSNIELVLGVPNFDLQSIATNNSTASDWVKKNVLVYYLDVRFRYIVVGNEVSPRTSDSQFLLPAMQNIQSKIASAGLQNQIKVSTALSAEVLGASFPPSQGAFRDDVLSFIDPIIRFLANNDAPLLVNVYPYFSYQSDTVDMGLPYALFTSAFVLQDGKLVYQNLFDCMVDTFYSALEKVGGSSVEIVVSETGWPSAGNTTGASTEYARDYNSNLIEHVKGGSPKSPGKAMETYVFAMFDENLKGPDEEKHWGIFTADKQPKYAINFSSSVPTNSPPTSSVSNNPYCLSHYITLHLPSPL